MTLFGDALTRARWAIFWERLWPALASLATAVGLFLALSWLGLWLWLPPLGRVAGLVAFLMIAVAACLPLLRLRFPSRQDGIERLDRISGIPHRPATAIDDRMATTLGDAFSMALWRAHVARAMDAARKLKPGRPTPSLSTRDPYAVRALVLVLVAATFFAAGGERRQRIVAAFDFSGIVTPASYRVDAWVTPPLYTGKSPVLLPGLRPGEAAQTTTAYSVPVGSVLVIRASGTSDLQVAATGGLGEAPKGDRPPPAGSEEHRFNISDSGAVTLHGLGDDVTWQFNAVPDTPPMISLAKDPETQPRGALILSYKLEDDYGIADAKAVLVRPDSADAQHQQQPDGKNRPAAHPLYDPPEFPLLLPQARTRKGVGQTVKDLTAHPLAGSELVMTLIARDQAGNEGQSKPFRITLPERPFFNMLAKSLVELRGMLARDAESRPQVLAGLDALAIGPERFTPELGTYLGLRSLYWNLSIAKTDDEMRDVVSRLWAMAVELEDGKLGDVAAALRNAEQALRDALEHNASDEEIKRLTDQLRAAIQNYLQALAREMRKNPELAKRLDPNAQVIRPQDLQNLLNELENLARSGNKEAARQLLRDLQAMLDNLQLARPGQGNDQDMKALNDLADMIQQQRKLRDRTYQQGQDMRRNGQSGDPNQTDRLKQDQQALRDRLESLLDQLRKRGFDQPMPSQQGRQGQSLDALGQAGKSMGEAEDALGEGNAESAVDPQARALEALRKGAQGMAQAMQGQRGIGQGPGFGQGRGRADRGGEYDPLGRPVGPKSGPDTSVKIPDEIEVQRARRVIEELRRRLGELGRPKTELDYIERLLKDF